MKFLILTLFLFLVFQLKSQEVYLDMTNYQTGFFIVKLIDSEVENDTLHANSCGGILCNYPIKNGLIRIKFKVFIVKNGKVVDVPELQRTKRIKRRKIYYTNGFYFENDNGSYLVLKIGTKKVLSEKVEIDSPIFSRLLTKVESCW